MIEIKDLPPVYQKSIRLLATQVGHHWGIALFWLSMIVCVCYYAATFSCRIDDCFTYLRVADNFFLHHKPIYNPGDSHFIITSPLWLFLLIAGKTIFWNLDATIISKWLYIIFLAEASLAFRGLVKTKYPLAANLSPLAVFCPVIATRVIGMETALCLALALTLVWAFYNKRWIAFGLIGGLFYLARAEGALFVALLFIAYGVDTWKQSRHIRVFLQKSWKPVLACALIVFIWHIYYYFTFHQLFPNTLHAKMEQGLSGRWMLFHKSIGSNIFELGKRNVFFISLMLLGGIGLTVHRRWLLVWVGLHTMAYMLLRVPDYIWYYYPILFTGSFSIFIGGDILIQSVWRRSVKAGLFVSVCILMSLIFWSDLPKAKFRPWGDPRRTAYIQVANWISKHEIGPKKIVMDEIGIVGYYLKNYLIYDTVGLSNPHVTSTNMCQFDLPVETYAPSYIVLRLSKGKLPPNNLTFKGNNHDGPVGYRLVYNTDSRAIFSAAVYALQIKEKREPLAKLAK